MIDFRSDTVTRPTAPMREAMMRAEVGDDVFGEDPSVRALEEKAAALFGFAGALFCPSGTMTNQIAIRVHTRPGDEVICSDQAHVFVYEGGGIASNSGCQARSLSGDLGRLTAAQVAAAINPDDPHRPRTSLVCLENTVNRGGGSCYDPAAMRDIREICDRHGLPLHLDGARVFNALAAGGDAPGFYGDIFDSLSVCLSKGLGCPVGSLVLGGEAFIRAARRIRKVFGGGMRQAGFLAAAGIYALDHHVERLAEDHEAARRLAAALDGAGLTEAILPVQTNILIFSLKPAKCTPAVFAERMKAEGILVMPISATQVRMVTHLDIPPEAVERTCRAIGTLGKSLGS